jgi:hypothetical protein
MNVPNVESDVPDGCAECGRLFQQARAAVLSGDRSRLADVRVLQRRHQAAEHPGEPVSSRVTALVISEESPEPFPPPTISVREWFRLTASSAPGDIPRQQGYRYVPPGNSAH